MGGGANYSFSKFILVDKQFATIFRKIGATYFSPLHNLNTNRSGDK